MGGKAENIALTDSTTMGLGLIYSGLNLQDGEEVLHTVLDHYSTDMTLAYRANRTGAKVRRIARYENPAEVSVAVVQNVYAMQLQQKQKLWLLRGCILLRM
jgi:selenocysteine lyase/cysteine desulfurase